MKRLCAITLFIISCSTQKQTLEPVFNIPKILTMNIQQVKNELGNPVSEFTPNKEQIKLDPLLKASLEFNKDFTSIVIDYNSNGEISGVFISDKKEGRTAKEMMVLGSVSDSSTEYSIKIVNWINPTYAKSLKAAKISGIEVELK